MAKFLVTGGAGFIGSSFCRLAASFGHEIIVLDSLTYAGRRENLVPGQRFYKGDICDDHLVRLILFEEQPDAIFNLAAESHVCRSIRDSDNFVSTNIGGTHVLLKEALAYWQKTGKPNFRFTQVSTDEVYGDLGPGDPPFREDSPLRPHSPYSASKAAGDCLAFAFHHTYGLPVLVTRCSNNYGPRQHPEKLIPAAVSAFLAGKPFGLHGNGLNVRDWISVEDHCRGIIRAWECGRSGETYIFGGNSERTNLTVVSQIREFIGHGEITQVSDRLGNDRRYAIDYSFTEKKLNWQPLSNFEEELKHTVKWYCDNPIWLAGVKI